MSPRAAHRPLVSALVALIAVVVVFTLLLNAGPPTEWGR